MFVIIVVSLTRLLVVDRIVIRHNKTMGYNKRHVLGKNLIVKYDISIVIEYYIIYNITIICS